MSVRILIGDVMQQLATLPDESVHCVVTSPPYFGLRDYGMAGQIGLEPTPQEFIAKLVAVFREVRRVLRSDGTCWVNMGDSYAGSNMTGGNNGINAEGGVDGFKQRRQFTRKNETPGFKPKDKMLIPHRLAIALCDDGWWVRDDIVWAKPNPMPESVTDRCTKAHEYIFLLAKSERYFYDHEAIKEPVTQSTVDRLSQPNLENQAGSDRVPGKTNGPMKAVGHIPGNKTHKGTTAYLEGDERMRTKAGLVDYATRQRSKRDSFKRDDSKRAEVIPGQSVGTHRPDREESDYDTGARNKRSVWTIATQPFKEAHFATFPPALPEICIKAGTSEHGVCAHCGAPWRRVTKPQIEVGNTGHTASAYAEGMTANRLAMKRQAARELGVEYTGTRITTGWQQSCDCPVHTPLKATVLDPFFGAGTTGLVADRLQRDCIGIELNPAYAEMARKRIFADSPLFAEVAA